MPSESDLQCMWMNIDVRNKGRGVRGVNITKMMIFRGNKILEEKKVFSLIVFFFFFPGSSLCFPSGHVPICSLIPLTAL